jgi:hypothetical protein
MRHLARTAHALLTLPKFGLASRLPTFTPPVADETNWVKVVHADEGAAFLPPHKQAEFREKKTATVLRVEGKEESPTELTTKFYNQDTWKKIGEISKHTQVDFSPAITQSPNFAGLASRVLAKAYKFSRKEKDDKPVSVRVGDIPDREYVLELAHAKIRAAEWANTRADTANTAYFLSEAQRIQGAHDGVRLTTIKGEELL